VELVIRIALMFLFIQFLVVITIMTVGILLARAEVPVCEFEGGHAGPKRLAASALHLPRVGFKSIAKWVQSMYAGNGNND